MFPAAYFSPNPPSPEGAVVCQRHGSKVCACNMYLVRVALCIVRGCRFERQQAFQELFPPWRVSSILPRRLRGVLTFTQTKSDSDYQLPEGCNQYTLLLLCFPRTHPRQRGASVSQHLVVSCAPVRFINARCTMTYAAKILKRDLHLS